MAKGVGSHIRKSELEYFKCITVCHYCSGEEAIHIDHVVPPRLGGNSDRSNLVKACQRCNCSKSDLSLDDFFGKIYNKRQTLEGKVYGYIYRLKERRKRKNYSDHQAWLLRMIIQGRMDHSYYTRVLITLTRMIYG